MGDSEEGGDAHQQQQQQQTLTDDGNRVEGVWNGRWQVRERVK